MDHREGPLATGVGERRVPDIRQSRYRFGCCAPQTCLPYRLEELLHSPGGTTDQGKALSRRDCLSGKGSPDSPWRRRGPEHAGSRQRKAVQIPTGRPLGGRCASDFTGQHSYTSESRLNPARVAKGRKGAHTMNSIAPRSLARQVGSVRRRRPAAAPQFHTQTADAMALCFRSHAQPPSCRKEVDAHDAGH